MPNTKSKHNHWLIGVSTSVLQEDFVLAYQMNDKFGLSDWLPFKGLKNCLQKWSALNCTCSLEMKPAREIFMLAQTVLVKLLLKLSKNIGIWRDLLQKKELIDKLSKFMISTKLFRKEVRALQNMQKG